MPHLLGIVLAGGRSRRMGQDKAAILLPNGQTWLEHSFQLLKAVCSSAIVVTARHLPRPGYPCVVDIPGPEGPARAVAAALAYAAERDFAGILTLPCDMPHMRPDILSTLKANSGKHYLTAYVNAATGRIEMLAAVYTVSFLPIVKKGLAQGMQSLFQMVPPQERDIIPYGTDLAPVFKNCNVPADLLP